MLLSSVNNVVEPADSGMSSATRVGIERVERAERRARPECGTFSAGRAQAGRSAVGAARRDVSSGTTTAIVILQSAAAILVVL